MKHAIGDSVYYIPGYVGYHSATIVDYGCTHSEEYIIAFTSGKEIGAREDDLEAL